jgi:hypothetical protein
MKRIAINVAVRSAEQQVTIRLKAMRAHFDLRAKKVSEQIALDIA